jgi:hypothetical protein
VCEPISNPQNSPLKYTKKLKYKTLKKNLLQYKGKKSINSYLLQQMNLKWVKELNVSLQKV